MAAIIITPEQIGTLIPSARTWVNLDGQVYDFKSAYKQHSVTYLGNDTLRFELRDRDQFDWDVRSGATSERTMIATTNLFANKEAVDVSFGLNIEAGAPNTAKWLVLGQVHIAEWTGNLTGKSPPVSLTLDGERMSIHINYDKPDGTVVSKAIWTDLYDVQRGHDYKFDIKVVFDPGGVGRLVVTRDGTILTDYSGPLGYQQQLKTLWSNGIYREGSATETMAAQYSDLQIKTGSAVTFPDKSAFIDAPTLAVSKVGAVGADGLHKVDLTGTAKAGTVVTIFDGDTVLGKAAVGSDGRYSLSIKVDDDFKNPLSAIATNSEGRSGLEMPAKTVVIGTGAEIGAKLKDLVADGNVAGIYITDGTVITANPGIFSYIFAYGKETLAKIQGNYTFYHSATVTGQAYDRQDLAYDAKGVLTEKTRYSGGEKVFTETYKADGWVHQVGRNAAGITDVKDISPAGQIVRFEQYNAQGVRTLLQIKNADKSSEDHFYDAATGLEGRYVLTAADGSKEIGWLNLKGRAFTTEIFDYDAAGKMTEQHRYDADGTQIFEQIWKADGSRQINTFNGDTGARTAFTVYAANGARVETTLKAGDPYTIVQTISYDAAGAVISKKDGGTLPRPSTDAAQPVEVVTAPVVTAPVVTAPVVTTPAPSTPVTTPTIPADTTPVPTKTAVTVYAVDAKTGLKTGATVTQPDGSKAVLGYVDGNTAKIVSRTLFDSDGRKISAETFDAAGKALWSATYAADGSKVEKSLVAGGKTVSSTFSSDGRLTALESRDANGKLLTQEQYGSDGGRVVKTYDVRTGDLLSDIQYKADKSRVETYTVKDKPYAQQVVEVDAAGKIVEKLRYYGDAAKTLQFKESYHADGSSEIHSYDALGRETSAVLTTATTKDTLIFTFQGTATKPVQVHQEHYLNGQKVWVDSTAADGSHTQLSLGGTTLTSHAGVKDTFTGAAGKDVFVFGKDAGKDFIWQFTTSGPNADKLKFDAAGVHGMSDLQITAAGRHTVITYDGGDSITLYNVAPSQLKPENFVFV